MMEIKFQQFRQSQGEKLSECKLRKAFEPDFYQTDIGWAMNLAKWNGLSAKAKKILQSTLIEQEKINTAQLTSLGVKEKAMLMKEGMKFYSVPNSKTYLKMAVDSAYSRVMGRLKKSGRDSSHMAKLRAAYQQ